MSGLDKREDSDADLADAMSGFIVLLCGSLVRMMKPNAMKYYETHKTNKT